MSGKVLIAKCCQNWEMSCTDLSICLHPAVNPGNPSHSSKYSACVFKAKGKLCDKVLSMANLGAAILMSCGWTTLVVSPVLA